MLKLINIIKSFEGSLSPTLNSINLELETGEFCVLLGSNGSGKSTLMRCISGEYLPTSGAVLIDGANQTMQNRNNFIASVTQDINSGTIGEMTLLENMVLSKIRACGAKLSYYAHYSQEVIAIVSELGIGLESYLSTPLKALSGGQRQMVATMMAINSHPKILLLDEHTSALDPKTQKILMEYSSHYIKKHQITTIMITHKLDDARLYGNRIIMLHNGSIVEDFKERAKQQLQTEHLLELFHKYEDLTLRSLS